MASSNYNWLGFSLCPQELPSSQITNLSTDHTAPNASYGILEADWNMKSSSELSALVESSNNQPKLEDFLGGISFSDHNHKIANGYLYDNSVVGSSNAVTSVNPNNGTGLSMIKSWLRTQPVQPATQNNENKSVDANSSSENPASSQNLALTMSNGTEAKQGNGSIDTEQVEAAPRKAIDTFGQRTSIYRGVTRHRWTGRYEAHLWDNTCKREGQNRKGRQVYLGGYDKEDKAARAYDLAALKYWGPTTTTNFPISNYEKELEEMKHMTRQEFVASLRRKSSGFSRGASIYRGVTRHHQHGRWQARIGRVAGNKDLYLGTFSTQEEAAEAYDIAAIKFRGLNAVTNFEMSRYDVKSILESNCLPIGSAAKRLKDASSHGNSSLDNHLTSQLTDISSSYGSIPAQSFGLYYPYSHAQLGNNMHNFFQSATAMEHSTGSNSQMFDGSYQSYSADGSGRFLLTTGGNLAADQHSHSGSMYGDLAEEKCDVGYVNVAASREAYESGTNGAWGIIPTHPQTMVSSVNSALGIGQGPPVFTVWNDM
ncbi:AP2-like ethylene-responsive transcription factor [Rhynchospora pubera]|uniref:AP2-like ethylene-responsive transcription factor n=1 Tax=Rhynchospora pubera TaxID=906938 RepID=A0AAV8G031_9POAL|nr:AP2-like ethylene-responsive transcription factor [Rhynchospora pubera]